MNPFWLTLTFVLSRPGISEFGRRPHRHQHAVEDLLFFFYVRAIESDANASLLVLERFDRGIEQDRGEKFFQPLVQRQHQIAVGAGQQAGHHFDASHFAAERGVNRSQFQSDVAAADDEQRFRNVGQIECAGRIHQARAVELEARHDGRTRSGRDDDAVEGQVLFAAAPQSSSLLAWSHSRRRLCPARTARSAAWTTAPVRRSVF